MPNLASRRDFLAWSAAAMLPPAGAAPSESHQATGVKVGELTPDSVRIWTRRTRSTMRRLDGVRAAPGNKVAVAPLGTDPSTLEGSCPGDPGQMRVRLWTAQDREVLTTGWATVGVDTDFSHQFAIGKLRPATAYKYAVETRASGTVDGVLSGTFRTAPPEDAAAPVEIAMLSCQKYSQQDDARGFLLYDAIARYAPQALLSVGDNVYYDSDDPKVNHVSIARHHWHRMYSLPAIADCLRTVPGYWSKDDHDCYSDDCWPGYVNEAMKPFTFDEGRKLFPEQVPLSGAPYRRFRWGTGLEIFMMEGRDYRASNRDPDGPGKSLWGAAQKQWLLDGLNASKARWKLIVNPNPLIGPDRKNKHDNHANDAFHEEGVEFRRWLARNARIDDTIWLNGDRHWQYHSVDPETKVREFCCGAASDSHASGTPGEDPRLHRFHRVKGGFLAIRLRGGELTVEHRDVRGARVYWQTYV